MMVLYRRLRGIRVSPWMAFRIAWRNRHISAATKNR